ncbi:uncharacterized protein KD926_010209 [Aspergillus affinis]|uniref:uncharacterized protein n=1 Tax=Aspergillus affinis TaxID=1070780 RepID=UPI0022FECA2B|nr:uncharacterized protein KD926_010209 [Aspergillus affinis]KAI9038876.1 hypothetical protein KD926_010209 [Aspergillus affinis]
MVYFEAYPLTELDHLLMQAYMHLFLAFKTTKIEENIALLENGVSCLIQERPFLAGTIAKPRPERPSQRAYQVQPPSSSDLQASPMLHVKVHSAPISILERAEETPVELIAVKPQSPTPFPAPALRFQANIMTDGIILSVSWHHRFMDSFGCQAVFEGLSQFCRLKGSAGDTPMTGSPMQDATRQQISNIGGSAKNHTAFSDAYTYAKSHYQTEQMTRGYVLCPRKVETLKKACNSRLAEVGQSLKFRLSCDDIVTAIIWLSAAQARNRAFSVPHSSLLRYVSIRKLLNPDVSTTFFGNTVALAKSHCNVHKLSSTDHDSYEACEAAPGMTREAIDDLSHLAWFIRSSDSSIDASHVGDLLATLRASFDWDSLTVSPADVSVASLRKLTLYSLDFGDSFGPVRDVDLIDSNLHGQCIIRPPRHSTSDSPWEIRMAQPKKVFHFLEADPVLTWARVNGYPRL